MSAVFSRYRDVAEPIFLWGPGRTGSSLLYDLLSLHPDVVCYRWQQRRTKGLYGHEHWGGGNYRHLFRSPFPPQEGMKHHFGEALAHLQEGRSLSEDQLAQVRASYRRLAATSLRSRRLLDKSPAYTFILPVLDEMFPDARHVFCLRHPFAVANSYARRMREGRNVDADGFWGWKPAGWESLADASVEEKAVWLVTMTLHQGLSMRAGLGVRCSEARYETVVADPRVELTRLLDGVGLPLRAALLERLPDSLPNFNIGAPDLTSVDTRLRDELAEVSATLGYAV